MLHFILLTVLYSDHDSSSIAMLIPKYSIALENLVFKCVVKNSPIQWLANTRVGLQWVGGERERKRRKER